MNELIKVKTTQKGNQVVSMRELYDFLEIKTQFTHWSDRMFEYGFIESVDYAQIFNGFDVAKNDYVKNLTQNQRSRMGIETDYVIKIEMAKEISMIQRSEKGKQARLYFIECERRLLDGETFRTPKTFKEALLLAVEQQEEIERQQLLIEESKDKVDFYDTVIEADGSFDMREVSGLLKLKYGRNKLFEKLRDSEILQKDNIPYRRFIKLGYFYLIETCWKDKKNDCMIIDTQTRVTQKGIDWLNKNKKKYLC
jgi:anti-repressor protein